MAGLERFQEEYKRRIARAVHALIIGPTKYGKTDWAAQAALDGFELLYINRDNALDTLMPRLSDNPDAMKRVKFFTPTHQAEFIENLFLMPVIRWNYTQNRPFIGAQAIDTDFMCEIHPARIPQRVIVVIDSWSSTIMDIVKVLADKNSIDISDTEGSSYGRVIYGGGGMRVNALLDRIQSSHLHFIVMAHPAIYEIKEKPQNMKVVDVKEKDMIIRETYEIPQSISGPNGFNMGKYFNQIGWLTLNAAGNRELDFKIMKERIGGGTPQVKGDPRKELSFANHCGKPEPAREGELPWIIESTAGEWKAIQQANAAKSPLGLGAKK